MTLPLTCKLVPVGLFCLLGCSRGGADDLKPQPDAGVDLAILPSDDFALPVDLFGADLRGRDLASGSDLAKSVDLESRVACRRGSGWTAFRFHYQSNILPKIDVLGLPDSVNFDVDSSLGVGFADASHSGGANITSGDYIIVRFSLDKLTRINSATLTIFGRSYATTSAGSFRAVSQLHGDILSPANSVSQAWPYDYTSVDYTNNVRVGDAKGSTTLRLYAGPSSNSLIVNTVELCIDGS